MAEAEEVQELGRRGVARIKQWLEATTFIELAWNVYEDTAMCMVLCLGSKRKNFDLAGAFIGGRRHPVVVECKAYNSDGSQHKYYKEFLAIAYSSTLRELEDRGTDLKREFLWVTSHPFLISKWTELTSEQKVRDSLIDFPEYLDNREVDDAIVRKVAERVWVLVMHDKQEEISLPNEELMRVLALLKRKEPTL